MVLDSGIEIQDFFEIKVSPDELLIDFYGKTPGFCHSLSDFSINPNIHQAINFDGLSKAGIYLLVYNQ